MNTAFSVVVGLSFAASALLAAPSLLVEWARWRSPAVIFSVPVTGPVIALSIDDGPSAATPEILEVLRDNDARATFFVIGENVAARPGTAHAIVAAGHELGHHMMQDRPSKSLPKSRFEASFDEMDAILDGLGGSHLFRPGSGWYDHQMVQVAASRGYRTVLGSVYPFDAQIPAGSLASWYVLQSAAPGSILIMHDGPERGARTAEVLRKVLPELRRRGYRIVTVSALMALNESGEAVAGAVTAPAGSRGAPGGPEAGEVSP